MAKLCRVGKGAEGKKSVRFDLEESDGGEEERPREPIITHVQERFPGFFEMPERCAPFEMGNNCVESEDVRNRGFPAVIDYLIASSSTSPPNQQQSAENAKENAVEKPPANGRGKSLFARHFGTRPPQQSDRQQNGAAKRGKEENRGEEDGGTISDIIKNLQLIDVKNDASRLAMDPVQMDLASKCLRNVVPRVEQHIVRLFETLKQPEEKEEEPILKEARRNLDAIRALYLEQIESAESGRRNWIFAKGLVDPLADPSWMMIPIRRVLDALQQRNSLSATPDDIEIVRLTLLWTVLLLRERPALFRGFANPSAFYCRLAECFLIGPEVFLHDGMVDVCLWLIIDEFLLDAGQTGQLTFRLNEPIAGLDAFMPFYTDLLQRFEEYSSGDTKFSFILLVAAYLNNSQLDGIHIAQALWSPRDNIVRQMVLPMDRRTELLLRHLMSQREKKEEANDEEGEQYRKMVAQEHAKLLALYVLSLRNGTITAERNPGMFAIATAELRHFEDEWTTDEKGGPTKAGEGGETELISAIKNILHEENFR